MKNQPALKKWLPVVARIALVIGMMTAALPSAAFAASQTQNEGIKGGAELQKWMAVRQRIQANQDKSFDSAAKLITSTQDRIANYQKLGWDTTDLETALSKFQNGYASAKSKHDAAANLIAAHPGFNDFGMVDDLTLAQHTMESIVADQIAARNILVMSLSTFHAAVKNYVKQHKH